MSSARAAANAAKSKSRRYNSPLRDERLEETRVRILDGLLVAMRDGLADLSVPAVARAANVSVPTVYRHFDSKKALFEALAAHVAQKSGMMEMKTPQDPEGLFDWVRDAYRRVDAMDPTTSAAMAGALGGELRRSHLIPGRMKMLEAALAPALDALPPHERAHVRNLVVVLSGSSTLRTFKTYLGLSADEAAETVVWTLRLLLEAAHNRRGKKTWKRNTRTRRQP